MSRTKEDQLLHRLAEIADERDRTTESESDDPRLEAAARPLDAEAKARIVESLKQIVPEDGFPAREPAEEETPTAPLHFPGARTRRSNTWRFAVPLAAALVMVLAAIVYRSAVAPMPGSADALPTYAVRVAGTVEAERGGTDPENPAVAVERGGRLEVAPGNRLEIVLTPSRTVTDAPTARAFLQEGDGWRPVAEGFVAVSPQGAVRLDAIVGTELSLPDAGGRLLLVVGNPGDLPSPEEAARATGSGDRDSADLDPADRDEAPWRAFLFDLVLVSP